MHRLSTVAARQAYGAALIVLAFLLLVEPVAGQTSPDNATQPSVCKVKALKLLGWGGQSYWSPKGDSIVFNDKDAQGVYQLYTSKPDGRSKKCITCAKTADGPAVDRHKGFPAYHPSGKYIVAQVEIAIHLAPKMVTEPGSGINNQLWALTPDGKQWYQLTNYSGFNFHGVLYPRFSHNGKQLLWSTRLGKATNSDRFFGQWQLNIADFVEQPTPHLENVRQLQPGGASFYEPHGFSPDDTSIIFTADIGGANAFDLNIFRMNLKTQQVINVTKTTNDWNEHAEFSGNGKRIAYMSSRKSKTYNRKTWQKFSTEEYLMNSDGSAIVQLTNFNVPGHTEFSTERSVVASNTWSPDGSQITLEQIFSDKYDKSDLVKDRKLWVLTFAGACGNS